MSDKIRLNIGAGDIVIPGFIPFDVKDGHDAANVLPYADGSVDEIYASHVLEHIHHQLTNEVLRDWCRVLKPGGRLRIAIPNFDAIRQKYLRGQMSEAVFNAFLYGSHPEKTDWHRAHISQQRLIDVLRMCGMVEFAEFESEYPDATKTCSESYNIECFKRVVQVNPRPKVLMLVSIPRFGPVDFYDGVVETARKLGWGFIKHGGTEWGKGLTATVQAALADNPDYLMILDYDSVFTAEDGEAMLKAMQEHPEFGALFPVEAHRHQDCPLGWCPEIVYEEKDITKMFSGHFGSSMIRAQVFRDLPKPWFCSMPNPDTGDWHESIDADIGFWVLMRARGWKVGQHNGVHIGHMEWCVKWMSAKGVTWQPIQSYRTHGKSRKAEFDPKFWNEYGERIRRKESPQGAKIVDHVISLKDVDTWPRPQEGGAKAAAWLAGVDMGNITDPAPPTEEVVAEAHRKAVDLSLEPDVMQECERLAAHRLAVTVKPEVIEHAKQTFEEKVRNAKLANGRV